MCASRAEELVTDSVSPPSLAAPNAADDPGLDTRRNQHAYAQLNPDTDSIQKQRKTHMMRLVSWQVHVRLRPPS